MVLIFAFCLVDQGFNFCDSAQAASPESVELLSLPLVAAYPVSKDATREPEQGDDYEKPAGR